MASAHRRRTFGLVAFYVTIAAGWAVRSHWVAEGSVAHHPEGSSRALWRESSGAVLIAWLLHLAILLSLRHRDLRMAEGISAADSPRDRLVDRLLILISFVFLAVTVQTGALHDYILDLQIWANIREGQDP